jgi:branched-chain amino acid transport system substrate-binding protein
MVNADGGIGGRAINFITLDDGFSPPKTVEQVRRLVEHDKVLFIFQTLGSPPNLAIQKYLNNMGIPQLFVADGSKVWGQPDLYPWSIGWQVTYWGEARVYGKYILENHPDAKIGILYSNANMSLESIEGLGSLADDMIVDMQTFEFTDATVDAQIIALKESGANVFFNLALPKFAVQAIRRMHDIDWKPVHFMTSTASSVEQVLMPAGPEKSMGIISAIVLKDPTDSRWHDDQDFKDYMAFMAEWYPEGNPRDLFNAYGYSVASTLLHVLEQCGDNLTRANIMKQAASLKNLQLPMVMPDFPVDTGPDDYFLFEAMQLAKFDGTTWAPFGPIMTQH